jgi:mono/diheme cytochrome c family protein
MRTVVALVVVYCVSTIPGFGADAKAGQAVYNRSCKACHGTTGAPNPAIAKMTKVDMKDLKAPEVQSIGDSEMKSIITDGKGAMKPVKTVTGADLDNVVAYVHSLKR